MFWSNSGMLWYQQYSPNLFRLSKPYAQQESAQAHSVNKSTMPDLKIQHYTLHKTDTLEELLWNSTGMHMLHQASGEIAEKQHIYLLKSYKKMFLEHRVQNTLTAAPNIILTSTALSTAALPLCENKTIATVPSCAVLKITGEKGKRCHSSRTTKMRFGTWATTPKIGGPNSMLKI